MPQWRVKLPGNFKISSIKGKGNCRNKKSSAPRRTEPFDTSYSDYYAKIAFIIRSHGHEDIYLCKKSKKKTKEMGANNK